MRLNAITNNSADNTKSNALEADMVETFISHKNGKWADSGG